MSISKNSQNLVLDTKRHSFAHLLAAAVKQMFPETQFGVGPVIENGCYYDFILPRTLIPEDLPLLEDKIRGLLKRNLAYKVQELSIDEAIILFENHDQPLKVELLNDLRTKGTTSMSEEEKEAISNENGEVKITVYRIIDENTGETLFEDLCKGPHVGHVQELSSYPPSPLERGRNANPEAITELGRFPFNNKLVERAQEMMANPTEAEQLVWEHIFKSKLSGFKFSQQKIIDNYILDFYCSELLLAIEIDGVQHSSDFGVEYDKQRDGLLHAFGIKVVRIQNQEAKNIDALKQKIQAIIESRKSELKKSSTNTPPFKGAGGYNFKLDKFSGSYWRGDQERNIQMQRIYALVFDTQQELDQFIEQREEAKKRDHRVLGEQLGLFMFSEIVGKGLPLWLEKGATVRRTLERFIVEEEVRRGYRHVYTPDMAKLDLYEKSGHYPYYKDSMYAPIEIDHERFMLRPMTCPHHFQVYLQKPRSYKELPMRIAELAKLYRYEDSGALTGLTRVRSFCLADSHIVCTPDQVDEEIKRALDLIEYCATIFGLEKGEHYRFRLSLGDRNEEKKYFKDDAAWDFAEETLRKVLVERNEPFFEADGEAAFYGPKIDVQMKGISGKEETAFTVQFDFVMPKRFGLKYIDSEQKEQEALVVHRSSIGAIERVFAFLVEFYGGRFPFWLAPTQVKILTVNDKVMDYVEKIKDVLNQVVLMKPLKYNELRFELDDRSESLGKKIREAEMEKIPVILIVGPKDAESGQVSVRTKDGEEKVSLENLGNFLNNLH